MGRRNHHHVVSRGYLRLFADGERIVVADKHMLEGKVIGTRDAFVARDFNTEWTDAGPIDRLEDEWTVRENTSLPHVRRLIAGARDTHAREATKILAAVHAGRSFSFDASLARVIAQFRVDAPGELANDEELRTLWRRQYGVEPTPEDINRVVLEQVDAVFDSSHRVERMINAHNFVGEKLDPLHTQIIRSISGEVGFITSDTPFVHFGKERTGWTGELAFGDADHLYMPLSPSVAVMWTTIAERDTLVNGGIVRQMNEVMRRAAVARLACHPSTDIRVSLGLTGSRVEPRAWEM